MKILALETATDPGSIALWLDGKVIARRCPDNLSNSTTLLPVAEEVIKEVGLGFCELDGIAFGMGPGSFTGLRVGLAFALGLGAALDRPVLGLSTLEALAASVADDGGPVAALIDARRGHVYARLFDAGEIVAQRHRVPVEADEDEAAELLVSQMPYSDVSVILHKLKETEP